MVRRAGCCGHDRPGTRVSHGAPISAVGFLGAEADAVEMALKLASVSVRKISSPETESLKLA
jgi:hypothetical protein